MIIAYYDLAKCPPTYDVVTFLLWAEQQRLARGELDMEIRIIPGPDHGFRRDKVWPKGADERTKLLRAIVLPMCRLLPSATVVRMVERPWKRDPQSIGVDDYSIRFDRYVGALRAGIRPLRCEHGVHRDPQLVTITLREAEHWPARNSNPPDWLAAGAAIEAHGYRVVFIRDELKADEPIFSGGETAPEASRVLTERARLYQSAACNLGVNNGPMWMAIALNAPALMLKPTTEGLGRVYGADHFIRCGVPPGTQFPNSPSWQRIVWEPDRDANIVRAFRSFMAAQPGTADSGSLKEEHANG